MGLVRVRLPFFWRGPIFADRQTSTFRHVAPLLGRGPVGNFATQLDGVWSGNGGAFRAVADVTRLAGLGTPPSACQENQCREAGEHCENGDRVHVGKAMAMKT